MCRFKDAVCHGCGKTGHLRKVCKSKSTGRKRGQQKQSSAKPVHLLEERTSQAEDTDENYDLYTINSASKPQPYKSTSK